MCGISVIFKLPGDEALPPRDVLEQQMTESLEIINHRGPDSKGIWISPGNNVVLGHNRLAINDLSEAGYQPFHSPDGTLHAVVNGELYDYDDLKQELQSKHGYIFAGQCDSEIVLALYQTYGMDFLQYLRGEFALCIYDEKKKMFIAARDRYGIKPLFWTFSKGRMLVGAEIKAFLPLGWEAEWDVKSLIEAGWNFDNRTCFTGVKKVRPGHYMLCDAEGKIQEKCYWDLEYPNKTIQEPRTEEELIQGVRDRLVEAVQIRLRADVPVGVYLSGGIDSSVIAGVTAHLVKERGRAMGSLDQVSCFSVAFEKTSGFDESGKENLSNFKMIPKADPYRTAIAERTASFLGIKQYKQVMDEEAFAAKFEAATWHCEHHNPDLNYVGKFALSELPRKLGFKVVLTGEGADETFTGYHVFLPDFLREPDLSWSKAMPEEQRTYYSEKAEMETKNYYTSIGASYDISSSNRTKLSGITTIASMTAFMPDLFPLPHRDVEDPQDVIANALPRDIIEKIQTEWHPINTAQYVWTKTHLPNQFLSCLGDRTEMAHSIEARTPFLDHHLTEYVNQIPPSLKVHSPGKGAGLITKHILREAMRPFITEEIYQRAKFPFTAPVTYGAGGPLHELMRGLITEGNVKGLGFVDWEKVKGLVERAFGDEQEAQATRLMIVVAQWIVLGKKFGVKRATVEVVR